MSLRVLGVIPARGGSKGIPRKNIAPLGDRPLLAHTLAAVAGSERLTRTVVSTDDAEIAAVAAQWGGDVPFLRPADLAADTSAAIPNIQHALRMVEEQGDEPYDAVLMLQPTAPFRRAAHIDEAVALLETTGADSVISVVDVEAHHPARMKYLDGDRLVDPPFGEARENQNRQELRPMFLRNGAIYLTRRDILLGGSFKGTDCRALVMPALCSVNIDTPLDLRYAEWLLAEHLVEGPAAPA